MNKVLIIGAARSGSALAQLLVKNNYEVYLTDLKEVSDKEYLNSLGVKVFDKGHPEELKKIDYDFVVKNPGIKPTSEFPLYFSNKGYFLYTETEIATRFCDYQYGCITGTNGKTTTTTLLGEFLKCLNPHNGVCGNIGTPLSTVVLNYPEEKLSMALEISGFQLLGVENLHPIVSTCLNLTPDHIDYFGDVQSYYDAKMKVCENQSGDDWFIYDKHDLNIISRLDKVKCRKLSFSTSEEADICIKDNKAYLFDEELFPLSILKIVGLHNVANAMVAASMAIKMGVSKKDIVSVLESFEGVRHRIQFVKEINGVKYYNDSKGTNPESTIVALKAFEKPVILLAGGYDKKTGFKVMQPYWEKVKYLICFGDTKNQLKEEYPDAYVVEDMEEALNKAYELAQEGDVVLLSPMCASYDQFPNFEVRGDQFIEMVNNL